ncbi:carbamoyltransferase HypF [Actinoplanes sp. NPDC049599]|uniref:carbamoyltransferase HypF n=1 Tax=Actinoplanes sp. NPDC049599 TaxID=3363903 RepID=UPI00378FDB2C
MLSAAAARTVGRLEVHGTVQGVGFRPFVYRLARSLDLDGWVRNDDGLVVIEAAGSPEAVAALATRLRTEAPPHARVVDVRVGAVSGPAPRRGCGFHVEWSRGRAVTAGPAIREIPPDLATCDPCRSELFDPADRRYRYPFLNCTDCGPRATIIDTLPYDRERTTMWMFGMCRDCAREYADPANRRFHAEPVACPACGPRLAWAPSGRDAPGVPGEDALRAAEELLLAGGIVAVKGLGGYQLVCDAADAGAVDRLRARKRRPSKPFAVMVPDLATVGRICRVDHVEAALLTSVARPVVLLEPAPGHEVTGAVAGGAPRLGLFLPGTPLHHLLLADLARPLVVTSGNLAEEPITIADADARERLAALADGFLSHDRSIRSRYDDSVTRVVAGRPSVVRRARGYAPAPIGLPIPAPEPLLAVGAQLKHTFTLAHGGTAIVGPHTGDLEQEPTMAAFTANLAHLSGVVGIEPSAVAHDLHPGYLSTQYAAGLSMNRRIGVQHHHAHVASCAAEHAVDGPFIGVAYDGLGLGDDGTLWGGEVFVADLASYRRVARFGRAPLPGGAAAVRRPARMALGYLFGAETLDHEPLTDDSRAARMRLAAPFLRRLPDREVAVVSRMVARGVNCPVASSAGRLFDAAAALLGLGDDATYEGEAAVALEAAAGGARPGHAELPWRLISRDDILVYDPWPTLRALLHGLHERAGVATLAARFHSTITAVTVTICTDIAERHGTRTVCLSGGVMQNQLLAGGLLAGLSGAGLHPLINERVPANDGGISYGQAAVAAARLQRGEA